MIEQAENRSKQRCSVRLGPVGGDVGEREIGERVVVPIHEHVIMKKRGEMTRHEPTMHKLHDSNDVYAILHRAKHSVIT